MAQMIAPEVHLCQLGSDGDHKIRLRDHIHAAFPREIGPEMQRRSGRDDAASGIGRQARCLPAGQQGVNVLNANGTTAKDEQRLLRCGQLLRQKVDLRRGHRRQGRADGKGVRGGGLRL